MSPANSARNPAKRYLDRGWCEWLTRSYPASEADFREATERMLPPADQAVGHVQIGRRAICPLSGDAQDPRRRAQFRGDVTVSQTNLDYAHNYFSRGA